MWRYGIWSRKSRKGKQSPKKPATEKKMPDFFTGFFENFCTIPPLFWGKKPVFSTIFQTLFPGKLFCLQKKNFFHSFPTFFQGACPKTLPWKKAGISFENSAFPQNTHPLLLLPLLLYNYSLFPENLKPGRQKMLVPFCLEYPWKVCFANSFCATEEKPRKNKGPSGFLRKDSTYENCLW